MTSDIGYTVLLWTTIAIQFFATIMAILLIRRTKYNVIWILCIIGFIILSIKQLLPTTPNQYQELYLVLDFIVSLSVAAAVFFARRLIDYLDKLEHQRKLLNKRILTAVLRTEERSRSNFAKELHDGLGPLLSAAKMSLSALSRKSATDEQREIIDNTAYVIDEAIRSVREISNNMSPQVLMDFGLAQGVKSFISRNIALNSRNIRFTTNLKAERFDNDVEVIMYRVICELIHNSLKHSGCKNINLSLSFDGSELRLDYSDDGKGFNPKAVMDCGMGLSNISSRINSLNGTTEITSRKGNGMTATIRVNTHGNNRTTISQTQQRTDGEATSKKNSVG